MREHPTLTGIFITEAGEIFTTRRHSGGTPENPKLLTGTLCRGYVQYSFTEGKRKGHRLVAETYLPNPDNLPEVNHKDRDKTNNDVSNLEWSTSRDNSQHANCQKIYTVLHLESGETWEVVSLNQFIEERGLTPNLYQTYGKSRKKNGHRGYRIINIRDRGLADS